MGVVDAGLRRLVWQGAEYVAGLDGRADRALADGLVVVEDQVNGVVGEAAKLVGREVTRGVGVPGSVWSVGHEAT